MVARTSGEYDRVVNVNVGEATALGLNPNTLYTVLVAAVNSAGTGPSTLIYVETPGEYNMYCFIFTTICKKNMDSLLTRWTHCICLTIH